MNIKKYGSKELEKDFGTVTFGLALWAYRKGEELPQKDFALSLGISPSSLCDLEKGRRIPSPSRAAKIAKQLGQSEKTWIQLAFQDSLRDAGLNYIVYVA